MADSLNYYQLGLNDLTYDLAKQIAKIINEGYKSHPFPRSFSEENFLVGMRPLLSSGCGCLFVCRDDKGNIGGILAGIAFPDFVSEEIVATEIMWRVNKLGKGYGRGLLERFEDWARKKKAKFLLMLAMEDRGQEKIIRVYESRGYKLDGKQFRKEF